MEIPNILYKYRHCNEEHLTPDRLHESHLKMLEQNQIYFSNPLAFNDPFDCLASDYLFNNKFKKSNPALEETFNTWESWLKNYPNEHGVLALSNTNESILMWSHYADKHTGFCIGFKIELPFEKNKIEPISYRPKRKEGLAIQTLINPKLNKILVRHLFFTKHPHWHYEEEYRMVGEQGTQYYQDNNINRIIFGLKMSEENKQRIRDILKNKKINFYQATLNPKKDFSLKIAQV